MDDDEACEYVERRYGHLGGVLYNVSSDIDEDRLRHGLLTGEWLVPIKWQTPGEDDD